MHEKMKRGKEVLVSSAANIVFKLFGVASGFVIASLLARNLGADEYGRYVFLMALSATISIPIRLGLPKLLIRETAYNLTQNRADLAYALWGWAHWIFFATTIVTIGIGTIVFLFSSMISEHKWDALVLAALIVITTATEIRVAILHGLGRTVLAQIPTEVIRPALFIAVATSVLVVDSDSLSGFSALLLQILCFAVAFLVSLSFFFRLKPDLIGPKSRLDDTRALLWSAILLGSVSGLQTLNASLDSLMIRQFEPSSSVGIYKIASLLAAFVAFGLQAVIVVISPKLAAASRRGSSAELQEVARSSTKLIFVLSLVPGLAFIAFGRGLIDLAFGREYLAAYWALVVLVGGQILSSFFGPVGAILTMSGNEALAFRGVLFAASGNVALNFLLIPFFGILGAAIATAVTTSIWNILLWHSVRKRLGVNTLGRW